MLARPQPIILPEIAEDVLAGLSAAKKWLSPKLFYDAEGSRLFERITELPEYYLTRTEASIFQADAPEMVALAAAGEPVRVVELGAGSAAKTTTVLRAVVEAQGQVEYFPVDVSNAALEDAVARLRVEVRLCRTHAICADYRTGMGHIRAIAGRKLVLYIGSSIGNFEPMEATALLADLRRNLNEGDAVLLGTDMRKAPDILVPAYDDAQGVTAAFNRNVLYRMNRELGADFMPELFSHRAVWNERQSRMEMHLESVDSQVVRIRALDMNVSFEAGETIHTENSYKFTGAMIRSICRNAGLTIERSWEDERGWFRVSLLRA
ncbi:MAG: L-histidine N(alpha)-methyltransferase [Acidobacteriales bacterium]|nr:L-histidine N(alpha)-methyltransferase [Terriglobales bacterium]